tara:strand:- start:4520 stop:4798 length:279 start_codon:yes stop_codon:yes gene_type:complete
MLTSPLGEIKPLLPVENLANSHAHCLLAAEFRLHAPACQCIDRVLLNMDRKIPHFADLHVGVCRLVAQGVPWVREPPRLKSDRISGQRPDRG